MYRVNRLALAVLALLSSSLALSASEGHGVSPKALPVFEIFGLPITNSILTSWVVSLLILLGFRLLIGKPSLVPSKGQAVVEDLVQGLRDLLEPILGKKTTPAAFPLLICIFLFILIHNWSGLLPGVGTIGWGHHDAEGHFVLTEPWIRPANADFNATIGLALVSFGGWFILILKYAGPKLIIHDIFGNKADKKELPAALYYGLSVVFLMVGFIEILSIFIRPLTLSARLFGNVYGGENLLHATYFAPPFYFLEALVGLVQAFVFTLLSSVYIGLICNHGDDHDHEGTHEGAKEAHH